ncbi:MAG TPA: hypothetical protein VD735_02295 [Candidatus Saccharimonadales bacterium]|nr:hypothetical protein [Candidatus Saccharimonadales bacterium]
MNPIFYWIPAQGRDDVEPAGLSWRFQWQVQFYAQDVPSMEAPMVQ